MVIKHMCPVCGYGMQDPPCDYNICPSCGTEFGVHDMNASIGELRKAWLQTGPRWSSATEPQPAAWNPFAQIAELLFAYQSVRSGSSSVLKDWPGSLGSLTVRPYDVRPAKEYA